MTIKQSLWTGMVPIDDTALAVTDTDGDDVPVIYLNGHAAVQRQWRRVLAELGPEWRHITYDMRGRGKSKRSADYSFETNIRDVDAVLAARGVARAVVVGWSYGAFVAAHWASRNPARTVGAVLVEGAQPYDWFDESMEPGMRKIWKRIWWPMQLLRPFGMAPRMTGDQLADSNIEVGKIARERDLGPRAGQHHRPGALRGRFWGVLRKPGRARTDTRQPPCGDCPQSEHPDQRESRQQPRFDPA